MRLHKLLNALSEVTTGLDLKIANLCIDSRDVQQGDLFIAIKGASFDGRDYIPEALEKGAVAVFTEESYNISHTAAIFVIKNLSNKLYQLAQAAYGHSVNALPTIGITGTNGKSSCVKFIAELSRQQCASLGGLGAIYKGHIKKCHATTPDIVSLYNRINFLVKLGAKLLAMEVSSHGLAQNRAQGVNFTSAIFTNLSQDHLDYHQNMQEYFAAKTKLFTDYGLQHAIVNIDDCYGKKLLQHINSNIRKVTYGLDAVADITAIDIEYKVTGLEATIKSIWGTGILQCHLLGRHNLSNLLASIAACCLHGMDLSEVLARCKSLQMPRGRMQQLATSPLVFVDFAHTPDALSATLAALKAHYTNSKIYCVFGCGGDRDKSKRPLMLQAASQYSDVIVLTNDNPRTEDPKSIVADILQYKSHKKVIVVQNRKLAIEQAIAMSEKTAIVLIAGKGHEQQQIIGDKKIPFCDATVATTYLQKHINNGEQLCSFGY